MKVGWNQSLAHARRPGRNVFPRVLADEDQGSRGWPPPLPNQRTLGECNVLSTPTFLAIAGGTTSSCVGELRGCPYISLRVPVRKQLTLKGKLFTYMLQMISQSALLLVLIWAIRTWTPEQLPFRSGRRCCR